MPRCDLCEKPFEDAEELEDHVHRYHGTSLEDFSEGSA